MRNLSIGGAGTGLNGVRFLAGKQRQIEHVQIHGFTQSGIDMQTNNDIALFVIHTTIGQINSATLAQAAIMIKPGAAGKATAALGDSRIEGNRIGPAPQPRPSAAG